MAALTVTGSACSRNRGQRSMVPPARSMRVGASASTRSGINAPRLRSVSGQDGVRLPFRLERHEDACLSQSVDRERVQGVADIGRQADGDSVKLQNALDELGLQIAPGAIDDGGHDAEPRFEVIIAAPPEQGQPEAAA